MGFDPRPPYGLGGPQPKKNQTYEYYGSHVEHEKRGRYTEDTQKTHSKHIVNT